MKAQLWNLFNDHVGALVSKFVIGVWIAGEAIMATSHALLAQLPDVGAIEKVVSMNDTATWKYLTLCTMGAVAYLVKQSRDESILTRTALSQNTQVIQAFLSKVDGVVMPIFTGAVTEAYQPEELKTRTVGTTRKRNSPNPPQ